MTIGNTNQKSVAYVALGSNLDSPLDQVVSGAKAITNIPQTRAISCSSWYQSKAVGPGDQPDYINGVIAVETLLGPLALLDELQRIEQTHGRERLVRWAARTLDLDILMYDDQVIETDRLQIPHPRLTERNFVLYPLSEIASDLRLPNGTTIESLLALTSTDGLAKIASTNLFKEM